MRRGKKRKMPTGRRLGTIGKRSCAIISRGTQEHKLMVRDGRRTGGGIKTQTGGEGGGVSYRVMGGYCNRKEKLTKPTGSAKERERG